MHLTPTERDRLLLFTAAELARSRRAAGVLLNVPEATALVADAVCEAARRGGRHEEAVLAGRAALAVRDVLPQVPYVVRTVSVEAVFLDGSRLVVVDEPFGPVTADPLAPGAIHPLEHIDPDLPDVVTIEVRNTSTVPISVTSHFHFFETNPRLLFDRGAAYGRHLAIPAGSHIRIDAGDLVEVALVAIRGARVVIGFAGLVDGPLDAPGVRDDALGRARACGFLDTGHEPPADPEAAVPAVLEQLRARPTAVAP